MLAPGTRLGRYEIVSLLGAGAMGEVYRATDAKLSRDVAVKVLPPAFATDTERLRRFDQEARAVGQLNHPNILGVFDVGAHDGAPYVVTELLEGETLRERLSPGPLPPRRAIEIAIQFASGLAAAHENGIVHRDLKPENLFITREGRLKILDFGLAKLTRSEQAAFREYDSLAGTLTETGVILGTAGYMAPEQVRGEHADHRADLFAFGAIMYEMLSGKRAFHGETAVDTLGAILHAEPPELAAAGQAIPPGLERIVRHCLEKQPAQRFQSARDVGFALESLSDGSVVGPAPAAATGATPRSRTLLAVTAALAVALVIAAIALPRVFFHPAPAHVARFSILAPADANYASSGGNLSISPDGRMLAFIAAESSGVAHLWVRPLDSFGVRMLPGTENSYLPFWSPDSRFIGYFIEGKLKRTPAGGGPSEVICDAVSGRGGTWNRNGVILFAPTPSGPLFRVPASGGEPVQVTTLDSTRRETAQRFPVFLPDGRRFLYVSLPRRQGGFDVVAGSFDSKAVRRVARTEYGATVTAGNWLLTARHEVLMAQRLDPRRVEPIGDPISVGEVPSLTEYDGEPPASASANGVIACFSRELSRTRLTWFDRTGRALGTVPMPEGRYEDLALAPDGKRAAVVRRLGAFALDIWIADLARSVATRLTFDETQKNTPLWTPDGQHVLYGSNREGPYDFYIKLASGAGDEELFYRSGDVFKFPIGWTPDGGTFLFQRLDSRTAWDVVTLALQSGRPSPPPAPFLHSTFNEAPSALSPDGRWLAYSSEESGRAEVYIQSFPNPVSKYQISSSACNPQQYGPAIYWTRSGEELIYGGMDGSTLMSVAIPKGDPASAAAPRPLFRLPSGTVALQISSDGQRFLATVPAAGATAAAANVILGWAATLPH